MEASILRFLGFLAGEIALLVTSAVVVIATGLLLMKSKQLKGQHIFLAGVVNTGVSMLFQILLVWILTGHGYASIFLSILVVSLVLMGLTELLWLIFGEPNVPWAERVIWNTKELNTLFPSISKTIQMGSLALFIVYPIYISFGFFGKEFGSNQWDGYVLRATLVLFIGSGYLVSLPGLLHVLISRNITEGTRSRIFIAQLVNSIPFLMVASFFVWSLEPQTAVSLVGKLVAYTPSVLYTTLTYVVLILVIPYLIGHYRNKSWMAKLDGDRAQITEELLQGIRSPLLDKAKEALVEIDGKIVTYMDELAKEKSYRLVAEVSNGTIEELPFYQSAAQKSIQHDPRFLHTKKLAQLRQQAVDCLTAFGAAVTERDKLEMLKNFAESIKQPSQPSNEERTTKPWVLTAITAIVLAITNPIITALGKRVASIFGLSADG